MCEYLIKDCVKKFPLEICPLCNERVLPVDPTVGEVLFENYFNQRICGFACCATTWSYFEKRNFLLSPPQCGVTVGIWGNVFRIAIDWNYVFPACISVQSTFYFSFQMYLIRKKITVNYNSFFYSRKERLFNSANGVQWFWTLWICNGIFIVIADWCWQKIPSRESLLWPFVPLFLSQQIYEDSTIYRFGCRMCWTLIRSNSL